MTTLANRREPLRHPAGTPMSQGGEFKAQVRQDTGMNLVPLAGNFEYPPIFSNSTAEELIEFYESQEIPNDILKGVYTYYEHDREVVISWLCKEAQSKFVAEVPHPSHTPEWSKMRRKEQEAAIANHNAKYRQAWIDKEAEYEAKWEKKLHRSQVLGAVMASAMYLSAIDDFPDEERFRKVANHPIQVGSETTTVRDAAIRFQIWRRDFRDGYDYRSRQFASQEQSEQAETMAQAMALMAQAIENRG